MTPGEHRDWLEWRRGGLGGSDVAAILGLSPFRGGFDVWLSKVEGIVEVENRSMLRGHFFERAVAEHAAELLGANDLLPGKSLVDHAEPWIRGTLDFTLDYDATRKTELLEVKTTRYLGDEWGEPGTDAIPVAHRVQVAWYLRLSRLDVARVAVWSTTQDRVELYRVERDLVVEKALVDRAREWWQRHVVGGEAPALDGSQAAGRYLQARHPEGNETMLDADDEVEAIAARLRELRDQAKTLQREDDRLEQTLKARIGDAKGIAGRFGNAKWSRYTTERLDAKALRAARPDLVDVLDAHTKRGPASRLWLNFSEEPKHE
jgi:putative phage-type endonuclease